jgi:hypothetical protein
MSELHICVDARLVSGDLGGVEQTTIGLMDLLARFWIEVGLEILIICVGLCNEFILAFKMCRLMTWKAP